jgi:hypothetical protein
MTDSTLQRVWDAREAISRRCDYGSRKLVRFYQSRQKATVRASGPKRQSTLRGRPSARPSSVSCGHASKR